MRKLMKKHEKNGAYDDSDDERNPYASSVRIPVFEALPCDLDLHLGGGGARRGAATSTTRPCHHSSRAETTFVASHAAGSNESASPRVRDQASQFRAQRDRQDGQWIPCDVTRANAGPWRPLDRGEACDESEDA